jgi:hypothetical protein
MKKIIYGIVVAHKLHHYVVGSVIIVLRFDGLGDLEFTTESHMAPALGKELRVTIEEVK